MELTEQQALEIAYMFFPNLKNRQYRFSDERNDPHALFSYELFIFRGRTFDGHRTTTDILTFSFSDTHSHVTDDNCLDWDITDEVKKYLEQHNAGAGV